MDWSPPRRRRAPRRAVLVVDDEPSTRMVFGTVLRHLDGGTEVIAFEDPVKALVWAHRHRARLVVSDFHMPHMDGSQFVAELRRLPGYERTPILVVSASEHGDELALAVQAGADRVLRKPAQPRELLEAAERLIAQHRGDPEKTGLGALLARWWRALRLRLPRGK